MTQPSIAFTIRDTALGFLLVAASERGVCHVRFGDSEAQLAAALAHELPAARLERDDARLAAWAGALARAVAGEGGADGVPLDVAGSRFQRRVWDALRAIPRGRTLAYGDVAAALGAPRAPSRTRAPRTPSRSRSRATASCRRAAGRAAIATARGASARCSPARR